MNPNDAADRLMAARRSGVAVAWRDDLPVDRAQAYAVQDASLAWLGPIAGWKVGASGPTVEPHCAPLPVAGFLPSGATLKGAPWHLRCVEVEAALRVARDLDGTPLAGRALVEAFDAVVPVIEVVETRLAGWPDCDPQAKLADMQSHGALIVGTPSPLSPAQLDLRTLDATLSFDGHRVAETHGGNVAADVWALLGWLVGHCARRGHPLRAGQIVTTGTCTGMLFAPEGARARGEIAGLGAVDVQF